VRLSTKLAAGVIGSGNLRSWSRPCPVINPTMGAELLTDGAMENWTSATNLTSWTESIGGSSTVNQEAVIVQAGASSARLDIDGASTAALIFQGVIAAVGVYLHVVYWGRASAGGKTLMSSGSSFGGNGPVRDPGAAWVEYVESRRVTTANPNLGLTRGAGTASASLYIDTASCKPITYATMLAFLGPRDVRPGDYQCNPTAVNGTKCGIVISYADENNHVQAIVDRLSGTAKIVKRIAGVFTEVISGAIVYGDGKILKATIASNGTDYSLFYDGAQVGVTTAIADAGLGTRVYGFSCYSGNTVGTVTVNP
jgi:hypothetical protein